MVVLPRRNAEDGIDWEIELNEKDKVIGFVSSRVCVSEECPYWLFSFMTWRG
jgi:hypothetical protein